MRSVWAGWREFAGYLGDFQARLILTVFFFTVMVPFGLLARLVMDPLQIRHGPAAGWSQRKPLSSHLDDTRRLF